MSEWKFGSWSKHTETGPKSIGIGSCRSVGTALGTTGLASSGLGADLGPQSTIPGRILQSRPDSETFLGVLLAQPTRGRCCGALVGLAEKRRCLRRRGGTKILRQTPGSLRVVFALMAPLIVSEAAILRFSFWLVPGISHETAVESVFEANFKFVLHHVPSLTR